MSERIVGMKYGISLLPTSMLDDEPVLRAFLVRNATEAGYDVAADAVITSGVLTEIPALGSGRAAFAQIEVTGTPKDAPRPG